MNKDVVAQGTPMTDLFESEWDHYNFPMEALVFARELEREVAALSAQVVEANKRFESHVKAVSDWTSELAETLGLGQDGETGPFKPENLITHAERGRQWAADMQSKLAAAEAQVVELQKRLDCLTDNDASFR